MSQVFERIDKALEEVRDGWCTPAKAHLLASAIIINRPALVVEIGVWAGRSLIPMAIACQEIGNGRVIGIDPWDNKASSDGMTGADLDWWASVDHEAIYQQFLSHVKRLDLESVVTVIRMKSSDAPLPDERIDLLSLDGNHAQQAIEDVKRFGPLVRVGGLVLADDLNWAGGSVGEAVNNLMSMGFEKLASIDQAALFKRTKRA